VQNAINVCGSEETPSVMFIGQLGIDVEGRYQDVRALSPPLFNIFVFFCGRASGPPGMVEFHREHRPFVFLSPGTHPPPLFSPPCRDGTGQEVFSTCLSQFNCAPVFLPLSIKDRFYKGMCKQIMWPMFHYVLPMSPTSNARFDPNLWQVSKNLSIRSSRSNHATAVR
jgi:hypothetical protein